MAVVRLSDTFIHDVYGSYTAVDNPERSAFFAAGVIARDEAMDGIARAGGKLCTVPFWQDIDPSIEPNYSNDDPEDEAVPNKIGSGSMTARKAWVNQGFASMDLVRELASADPMDRIRNRFGTYWLRAMERRLLAMTSGLLAANIAQNGSDMVVDISGATGDAAKFNGNAVIDAAYTMGDNAEAFQAIAVHSSIKARMVKNDDIVPASQGDLTLDTYKGLVVVTSDNLPKSGSGADTIFTSVLFGGGAVGFGGVEGNEFAYGEGVPAVPYEMLHSARIGNGGGGEEIWERNTWLMHPFGYSWVEAGAALTEMSPTLADLRLAAHWQRVVARKQVPLAFVKSKG